jgi:hypothetical protein
MGQLASWVNQTAFILGQPNSFSLQELVPGWEDAYQVGDRVWARHPQRGRLEADLTHIYKARGTGLARYQYKFVEDGRECTGAHIELIRSVRGAQKRVTSSCI